MRIVAYLDVERIESIVVYEADLSTVLTNLQNEGYLIIGEEKVPASRVRSFDRYLQLEGDEKS